MVKLSDVTRNRIARDAQDIQREGIPLKAVSPLLWRGRLRGRKNWAHQTFDIEIKISQEYPYKPPVVRFLTAPDPAHPNISPSGYICLNLLMGSWDPKFKLLTVWDLLGWLLENPKYSSGFTTDAWIRGQMPLDLARFIRRRTW